MKRDYLFKTKSPKAVGKRKVTKRSVAVVVTLAILISLFVTGIVSAKENVFDFIETINRMDRLNIQGVLTIESSDGSVQYNVSYQKIAKSGNKSIRISDIDSSEGVLRLLVYDETMYLDMGEWVEYIEDIAGVNIKEQCRDWFGVDLDQTPYLRLNAGDTRDNSIMEESKREVFKDIIDAAESAFKDNVQTDGSKSSLYISSSENEDDFQVFNKAVYKKRASWRRYASIIENSATYADMVSALQAIYILSDGVTHVLEEQTSGAVFTSLGNALDSLAFLKELPNTKAGSALAALADNINAMTNEGFAGSVYAEITAITKESYNLDFVIDFESGTEPCVISFSGTADNNVREDDMIIPENNFSIDFLNIAYHFIKTGIYNFFTEYIPWIQSTAQKQYDDFMKTLEEYIKTGKYPDDTPGDDEESTQDKQENKNNNNTNKNVDKLPDGMSNIYFIETGQADCVLIQESDDFMLIDNGYSSGFETACMDYLDSLGVDYLEYLILTHPHSDHINGAFDLLLEEDSSGHWKYNIGTIIIGDSKYDSAIYEMVKDALNERPDIEVVLPAVGDRYSFSDDSEYMILGPTSTGHSNVNNDSIAVIMDIEEIRFLDMGDAEHEEIGEIISLGYDLSCDILKANHHGSSTGVTEEFIAAVNKNRKLNYVVAQNGINNPYGHPHVKALRLYNEIDAAFYNTSESGTIIAHIEDGLVEIEESR